MPKFQVLYTNGDGSPEPDQVVLPGNVQGGKMYDTETFENMHIGNTTPIHERTDNYGNRWLKAGFEYPAYTSEASPSPDTCMSPNSLPNGDEPGDGAPDPAGPGGRDESSAYAQVIRKANEMPSGPAAANSGHAGNPSDKNPAVGLVDFKPGQSA